MFFIKKIANYNLISPAACGGYKTLCSSSGCVPRWWYIID